MTDSCQIDKLNSSNEERTKFVVDTRIQKLMDTYSIMILLNIDLLAKINVDLRN